MAYNSKYKKAEYMKRADKNYSSKIIKIQFNLNLEQTEKAKSIENPNKKAKELFLKYLEEGET